MAGWIPVRVVYGGSCSTDGYLAVYEALQSDVTGHKQPPWSLRRRLPYPAAMEYVHTDTFLHPIPPCLNTQSTAVSKKNLRTTVPPDSNARQRRLCGAKHAGCLRIVPLLFVLADEQKKGGDWESGMGAKMPSFSHRVDAQKGLVVE